MAFWDSASIHSDRIETSVLRAQRESAPLEASYPEPEVADKWHPGMTLGFIVVTCSLLWAGIFVILRLIF